MREFSIRASFVCLLSLLLALSCASAQDDEDEHPPAKKPGVRITFLPPPLEGTLSLGIFDKSGKLARSLHREATQKDFVVGLNGYITSWDGNDDTGHAMPAGKYFARGYAVGEVAVEGVAMHCNDWITDEDSPRIAQLFLIALNDAEDLLVRAKTTGGEAVWLRWDAEGKVHIASEAETAMFASLAPPIAVNATGGELEDVRKTRIATPGPEKEKRTFDGVTKTVASSPGAAGSTWLIDETPTGTEVKQFAESGELLRRLAIPADEPAPIAIAASKARDVIFLLEKKPGIQRVRGLALEAPAEPSSDGQTPVSTWKEFFSKSITASDTFAAVADKFGRPKPFVPETKIRVQLLPNELSQNASPNLDIQIAIDSEGAYLQASDGLLLKRITETPLLKWAVMGREGSRAVTIFQSDGAVVEEFKVRRLAAIMSFDAGDYSWKPKSN